MSDERVHVAAGVMRLANGRPSLEHAPMSFEEVRHRMERYLRENIPLSAAMGVRVRAATPEQVVLYAPLGPNINHHETVFGGSAAVLATLSAWTLLYLRLADEEVPAQLVIQRSSMEYEKPIPGDFEAECAFTDTAAWQRFYTTLERRGRARLALNAQLLHGSHRMASFSGDFVALRGP